MIDFTVNLGTIIQVIAAAAIIWQVKTVTALVNKFDLINYRVGQVEEKQKESDHLLSTLSCVKVQRRPEKCH